MNQQHQSLTDKPRKILLTLNALCMIGCVIIVLSTGFILLMLTLDVLPVHQTGGRISLNWSGSLFLIAIAAILATTRFVLRKNPEFRSAARINGWCVTGLILLLIMNAIYRLFFLKFTYAVINVTTGTDGAVTLSINASTAPIVMMLLVFTSLAVMLAANVRLLWKAGRSSPSQIMESD